MESLLKFKILDNTVEHLLHFLAILLLAYFLRRFLSQIIGYILYRFFRKMTPESELKKFNALVIKPSEFFIVITTITFAFSILKYPAAWDFKILDHDFKLFLNHVLRTIETISITWIFFAIADFISYVMEKRALRESSKINVELVPLIKDSIKLLITLFSLFFILGVIFKFNIASLLAGLGIGGLALALAAQESLKNLISTFTILVDKPFKVGDAISVDGVNGTVENIGFRSTRVRTTDKTFVTIPNRKIVDSNLNNLSLRTGRKVTTNLGLDFDNSPENINKLVSELQFYFNNHPSIMDKENYVRFTSFSDHALMITIEYYIRKIDFIEHQKLVEEVNFKILDSLRKNGCTLAKPV